MLWSSYCVIDSLFLYISVSVFFSEDDRMDRQHTDILHIFETCCVYMAFIHSHSHLCCMYVGVLFRTVPKHKKGQCFSAILENIRPSTTALNGNVSHKMSDQRAYSLGFLVMQQSTTPSGRVVCLFHPFSRGKVEKKNATDSEIDDTIRRQTTSTSTIEVYLSLTNSWPSYLFPKLPYPANPFKAKVHNPKGSNSARIISQDHRTVPSKCIHSSLRPQEACRHSIFSVHPVTIRDHLYLVKL